MKRKLSLGIILFSAFAARVFTILYLGKHIKPEIYEYDVLALNILNGKGYVYNFLNTEHRAFCYPGYSYLLVFFHRLTHDNYFAIEIFQAAVSVAACWILYLIAKKIFNETVALTASFLAAFHPALVVYTAKIHDLSLVVFLITLVFWLIISLKQDNAARNILIGAVIGAGTLVRPTLVLFLPVYFFYNWVRSKERKDYLRGCAVVFISAAVVLAPWTARNYKIYKRFIFITTTSAEHFWRGNNAFSSGTALTQDGKPVMEGAPKDFLEKLYRMKEIEQYDCLYGQTMKYIASHPAFFIKMAMKKFYYFWWFSPQTGLLYPGLWTQLYKIYYAVIFTLFASGAYMGLKQAKRPGRAAIASILLFLLLISAGNSLYYVESRHRWAVEPLMLIFSAYAMAALCGIFTKKAHI